MGRRAVVAAFFVALVGAAVSVAAALPRAAYAAAGDEGGTRTYAVTGSDDFTIGADDVTSEVTFRGRQVLTWKPHGRGLRFEARVDYARTEQGTDQPQHARYVSDLSPAGEQRDRVTADPEYLSVLNQPFSVRLDLPTLADLRRLRTDVPFDFPSPITGSTMHGRLRHVGEAPIDGRKAVGVGFAASGVMSGALPDRPGLAIKGAIALRGTAYYDAATALLLASQTTVTIVGNVSNPGNTDAVRITYTRAIRSGSPTVLTVVPSATPSATAVPASSGSQP